MSDVNRRDDRVTGEVGSEGGTDGEVEVGRTRVPATGSEAGETWSPEQQDTTEIRRDETGEGKRTPAE